MLYLDTNVILRYLLQDFEQISGVTVPNRLSEDLLDVKNRVYARDIFGGDS
jgi:UDPglucose 6-dehydrogenase